MRWFDLKVWAAFALATGACSDDGVPQNGADTDAASDTASASASAGETSDPSGGTSAVTTANTSDSDSVGSTGDPTGLTDSEGTTGISSTGTGSDASTGGSSSTGGVSEPECMVHEDCMLVDDCCSCTAIPMGEEPPECDLMECLVTTCTSLGLGMPQVQCNFGTCELEEVSCDPTQVLCDSIPPTCPAGQAPRVVDGCWGNCIPVEYCDVVPSCDACTDEEACIESVTQLGPSLTCVPIPPTCDGVPSCDCLGEACVEPFDTCQDGIEPKSGSELTCSCPTCG